MTLSMVTKTRRTTFWSASNRRQLNSDGIRGLFVYCVYALTVLLLAIAGALSGLGWFYFVMLACGAMQMAWQVSTLKIDVPDNCLARFKSNRDFGLIVFLGALLG